MDTLYNIRTVGTYLYIVRIPSHNCIIYSRLSCTEYTFTNYRYNYTCIYLLHMNVLRMLFRYSCYRRTVCIYKYFTIHIGTQYITRTIRKSMEANYFNLYKYLHNKYVRIF